MDNKNAAPERIELAFGYYWEHMTWVGEKQWGRFCTPYHKKLADMRKEDFEALAAAMQPTPSESDEALAREIMALESSLFQSRDIKPEDVVKAIAGVISRCRQPEAVTNAGDVYEHSLLLARRVIADYDHAQRMKREVKDYHLMSRREPDVDTLQYARQFIELHAYKSTAEADLAKAREVIAELVGAVELQQKAFSRQQWGMKYTGLSRDEIEKPQTALQSARAFMERTIV